MAKRWTEEDDSYLRDNYVSMGAPSCAEHLKRTASSVRTRAGRIGLSTSHRPWTDLEEETLLSSINNGLSHEKIGKLLNRSKSSVNERVGHLGKRTCRNRWDNLTKASLLALIREHIVTTKFNGNSNLPSSDTILNKLGVSSWPEAQSLAGITSATNETYSGDTFCIFYILEFTDVDSTKFKKFGITRNSIKSRYKGRAGYTILYSIESTFREALLLEKEVSSMVDRYIPKDHSFGSSGHGGYTECFTKFIKEPEWLLMQDKKEK